MRRLSIAALAAAGVACAGCQAPLRTAGPQAGQIGPTFTLKTLEGDAKVNLASYTGDRPVLLFFGSYT
ncbi:MAG: hypothetical protein ACE5GE_15265 [Phycisphaerae bacterium]